MVGERTGVGELLLEEYVGERGEQEGVGAGADGDMPVGEAGGPGAAGVDDREGAAATTQRLEPAGEVGGRAEAAVGFERVGAEEQQMVGAVDVRHRDGVRVTEEQSAGDVFGHLVEGARGEEGPGAERGQQGGRIERTGHGVHVRVAEDDTDGLPPVLFGQCGQGCRDRVERLAPTGLLQHAVLADEGGAEPVGVGVEPAEGSALGADEALAEDVVPVAAGAGDPCPLDGEGESAGGFAQGADTQGGAGLAGTAGVVRHGPSPGRRQRRRGQARPSIPTGTHGGEVLSRRCCRAGDLVGCPRSGARWVVLP